LEECHVIKATALLSLAKTAQRFTDCDKKPWHDMSNMSASKHGHSLDDAGIKTYTNIQVVLIPLGKEDNFELTAYCKIYRGLHCRQSLQISVTERE